MAAAVAVCMIFAVVLGDPVRAEDGAPSPSAAQPNRGGTSAPQAAESPVAAGDPERGYRLLLTKPFLTPNFDASVFDDLWKVWEEPLRTQAQNATPEQRRQMAFVRYGLQPRSKDDPGSETGLPMQYVQHEKGWAINCLACHGGKVSGQNVPGLPNSHFAFQTLSDEVKLVKLAQGKLTPLDVASQGFPMGETHGTTNAVMFGVAVLAVRDEHLNFDRSRPIPNFVHHDVDAPPWWHVKQKTWLYADGSTETDHRALMPFLLSSPANSGEQVRAWEQDFRDIYAWIQTLEPPKYPYPIDEPLARRGEQAFNRVCASCHGRYGPDAEPFPNKLVPIDVVGTDRVRLDALTPDQHALYERSWLSHYGEKKVRTHPGGYVAQPLHGIWATAPYFHNGSVPTLWQVLHPDQRPVVWQRSEDGYDQAKVGLEVQEYDEIPNSAKDRRARRRFFDTRAFGKGAGGHSFPEELDDDEKRAVLEYLKTL